MSLRQIIVLATCIAAGPNFNEMAQAAGKLWFGCSIDTGANAYQDETYMNIFNQGSIFGQTTPGNTMKWQFTEPENGQFDFREGQKTIDLAQKSDKNVRCHNLVWTEQLPDWVSGGNWTKDTLLKAMKTHIMKEINNYGSDCYSWDVVNKAVNYDGSYTDNIFLQTIGEDYVPYAFQYAHEAVQASGADIKLFYNDYQLSMPGDKVNTVVKKLIPAIQSAGDYIDGIGLESHHTTSYYPTADQLKSVMSPAPTPRARTRPRPTRPRPSITPSRPA
ncbi:endo-1,4-beta-xylanase [Aspergillus affinis]|uniref:endo-1,4-beta-xylanase n=1 Tax=Aspergillus affinis TaxID=1070780 RepID=UPI0022FE597B|nr:putative endo-1 [Aspergillus affinis]KAI9043256.1 putative endo-1 [Aspergillus affinis]